MIVFWKNRNEREGGGEHIEAMLFRNILSLVACFANMFAIAIVPTPVLTNYVSLRYEVLCEYGS